MRYIFKKTTSGFTLIELLVVVVLMSLITLVFLNRQNKFDSSTIMRSLAYSIALSVRQAQVYGISVRAADATSGNFSSAHGLYVSSDNPSTYIIFADKDNDKKYSSGDSIDQSFTINKGYAITEFCAVSASVRRCNGADDTGGAPGTISSLDIMFIRPNPDAYIYAYDSAGSAVADTYSSAYIRVSSLNNSDKRFIAITNTGQVSICAPTANIGSSGC